MKRNLQGQFIKGAVSPRKGKSIRGFHKEGCLCSVCRVMRGELKGVSHPAYAHKKTKLAKQRIALSKLKENNPQWNGGRALYTSIHNWIKKERGTPTECEHCGLKNHKRKDGASFLHWANKSGEYRRTPNDWLMLCPKCHKKYDTQKRATHS